MEPGWNYKLGEFAASLRMADLSPEVMERARLVVLHKEMKLPFWGAKDRACGGDETAGGARCLVRDNFW